MTANLKELLPGPIWAVVERVPLAPLGPGTPDLSMRQALLEMDRDLTSTSGMNRDVASACRAGLWLAFNFLEESHAISQGLETVEGSYWHAILHRREPDAANAAYWFRRVGEHPIFSLLARDAQELGHSLPSGRWDPFAFIDLCEEHRDTRTEMEIVLRRVQQREWEHLYAWCYTHSVEAG